MLEAQGWQVVGARWKLSVNDPSISALRKMRAGLIVLIVVAALTLSGESVCCMWYSASQVPPHQQDPCTTTLLWWTDSADTVCKAQE